LGALPSRTLHQDRSPVSPRPWQPAPLFEKQGYRWSGETTVNLHALLTQRAAQGRPVRVGLIGAGKFGSMYLAQARRTGGVQVVGIADLQAAASWKRAAWIDGLPPGGPILTSRTSSSPRG
jgi:hypothetical protein